MSLRRRKLPQLPTDSESKKFRPTSFLSEFFHVSRSSIRLGFFFFGCSATGFVWWTQLGMKENVEKYRESYNRLPHLVQKRCDSGEHHDIPLPKTSEKKQPGRALEDHLREFDLSVPFGQSVEPLVIIDARKDPRIDTKSVQAVSVAGSEAEDNISRKLCADLDERAWPDFLHNDGANSSGDGAEDETFFISFGVRRAFGSPLDKLGFLHAVVFVQAYPSAKTDSSSAGAVATKQPQPWIPKSLDASRGRFAIFGYNAAALSGKAPYFFLNDMTHQVSRVNYIYRDLTLKTTNRDAAIRWFEECERRSKFDYRLFSCNCFSPIFSTMLWAVDTDPMAFVAPEYFRESLCLTVPVQSNFGFGTSSNPMLRPYIDRAAIAINALVKDKRETA